jgi:D-alanine-D-alanine ligase
MDDASVVAPAHPGDVARLVRERTEETGRPFFAERFVEGREFNLSLLGRPGTRHDRLPGAPPQVLPPAEIDFSAFPSDKPRIVGYGAKWDGGSFEFQNTPRRFDFPASDAPLLRRLSELAIECWRLFDLRGYARVDFRCDEAEQPWILEINANPCLSPISGFAAALERAGIGYDGGVQRILDAALPPGPRPQSRHGRQPLVAR